MFKVSSKTYWSYFHFLKTKKGFLLQLSSFSNKNFVICKMKEKASPILKVLLLFLIVITVFPGVAQNAPHKNTDPGKFIPFSQMKDLRELWLVKESLKGAVKTKGGPKSEDSGYLYLKRLSDLNGPVPLVYNEKVRHFIDELVTDNRAATEIMLGLFLYYQAALNKIIKDAELPNELKFLPLISSSFNPFAESEGGTGLWMLSYPIAKMHGLIIDNYQDERRDPVKSTKVALSFLKKLHNDYGDWNLAVGAYFCGPANINKAIKRAGGKTGFWEIYDFLPEDRRDFISAFIAGHYLVNHYSDHNLIPKQIMTPVKTEVISVSKPIHFVQIAEVLELPIQHVRAINGIYKNDIIPLGTQPAKLLLPANYGSKFYDMQNVIYAYQDTLLFNLKRPVDTTVVIPTAIYYTVKKGDNLGAISSRNNVSVSDLKDWNDLSGDRINIGQKLIIYVSEK